MISHPKLRKNNDTSYEIVSWSAVIINWAYNFESYYFVSLGIQLRSNIKKYIDIESI